MNSEGVTVTGAEELPVCNAHISFDVVRLPPFHLRG